METAKWRPFCLYLNVLTLHFEVLGMVVTVMAKFKSCGISINSSPPGRNGRHFGRQQFQVHFHEWKW